MILLGCCATTNDYSSILSMGYDYIELSGRQIMELSDEQFKKFLKKYQPDRLPCRGFNDYCSGAYPIIGPGSGSKETIKYARKLFQRGHALGISTVGIGAPAARKLPEDYDRADADREMSQFLHMICDIAAEYQITVLLEAVHKYMCDYLTYTREVVDCVASLRIPNLAMVLDYYHAMVMNEDLDDFGYAMPYVRHLHISTNLENHRRGFLSNRDIPLLSRLLRNAIHYGYSGGISVEADLTKLPFDGPQCQKNMRAALLAAQI